MTNRLDQLAILLEQKHESMMAEWRAQVRELPAAKHLDTPTLNDHIPSLLVELRQALRDRATETIPEAMAQGSPPEHGRQRLQDGFDIEEVVAEYNILRGCIYNVAERGGITIEGTTFHIVNRVLDSAIGLAVQTYASARAKEVRQRREEYLAFVAHDLRTPLNAISMTTMVLEHTLATQLSDPGTAQMFKILQRNVQLLAGLVAKVLEENVHTEGEAGHELVCREFELWPLVEALVHDLQPMIHSAGARVVNQISQNLLVYADASVLRRIIQNLLANALKYAPNGEVTFGAELQPDSSAVVCWVRDTGVGIPPDRLVVIFEKFETDAIDDGHGLGLAIVKNFVEAHGGTVTVESEVGSGSLFRFTLPCRPKPS